MKIIQKIKLIRCLEKQVSIITEILQGNIEKYTKYSFDQLKQELKDIKKSIILLTK